MRTTLLAAAMAAGLQAAAMLPASAADMYDPAYGYYPKAGSPYDDPRYADIYGHQPPPRRAYVEPRYVERAPMPYRDDRYDHDDRYEPYERAPRRYLAPMDETPRFSDHDGRRLRRYDDTAGACTPKSEVKRELQRQGWSDFHDVSMEGPVAVVRARRASGRLFELRIDRCSGEVVGARPLGEGRPYAWRDRAPDDYRRY